MGIFDFLKKNKPSTKNESDPNLVFPTTQDKITLELLCRIAGDHQQPSWFWIYKEDGSTICEKNCRGKYTDPDFNLCRCPKCGYTIHVSLQPDYTCLACGQKVSAPEAIRTVSAFTNKAVYNPSLWPITLRLVEGLPDLIVESIGPEGTDKEGCEMAEYCFCTYIPYRERWDAMKYNEKLQADEVRELFTEMINHYMEKQKARRPERNIFAR